MTSVDSRLKTKIDYNKSTFTQEEKEYMRYETSSLLDRFPDNIPIIVRIPSKVNNITLEKQKFSVPKDYTLQRLMFVIRKKIPNLKSTEALYLFVNNTLPPSSKTMIEIYMEHHDPERLMLFLTLAKENTFG